MINRSIALIFALAASGIVMNPVAANAQGSEEERSVSVAYQDLDLSSEEGMEELDRRIDRAARYVCELDTNETGSRVRNREARECHWEARRNFARVLAGVIDIEQRGG